ncbi:MAG: hypothetical protein H6651_01680 [Ardenticatenales bacterium]|nr:hypothetical protein [Ardenticatenales bacterium]
MMNTTTQLTPELIQSALTLPAFDHDEANRQFASMSRRQRVRPVSLPGQPRVAAVLMLLYPIEQEWHLLLTKRRGRPEQPRRPDLVSRWSPGAG